MVGVFPKKRLVLFTAEVKKIWLNVTYNTQSSMGVIRTLQTSRVVTVSLPIAVNVEDFFRGQRFDHYSTLQSVLKSF